MRVHLQEWSFYDLLKLYSTQNEIKICDEGQSRTIVVVSKLTLFSRIRFIQDAIFLWICALVPLIVLLIIPADQRGRLIAFMVFMVLVLGPLVLFQVLAIRKTQRDCALLSERVTRFLAQSRSV